MINIEKFICSVMEQQSEYHNAPINCSHIQEALREQGYEYNNGAIVKISANWKSSEEQKEQKPAVWSEEDEKYRQYILANCMHYAMVTGYVDETHNEQLHEGAKIWLKSLRPKQKQEWCKDDEKILEHFLGWLQGTMGEKTYSSWLKSLRERFNLQPKQEWSEEDKRKLNRIFEILSHAAERIISDKEAVELQDFIMKSLRPQPHWKPSKEQMNELHRASIPGYDYDCDVLDALYNDLIKLMFVS